MSINKIVIGTRRSKLALRQALMVRDVLLSAHSGITVELKEVITQGDKNLDASLPSIGGKGLFTAELEQELVQWNIDIAVHSLKDLPTEEDNRFLLGAILPRVVARDVLISKDRLTFDKLPPGAIIGTSSPRRESQLRRLRTDLQFKDIRGNVDSRIRKVVSGEYSATLLAEAGLERLGLLGEVAQYFTPDEVLPAPGQGALAVQCAADRTDIQALLKPIDAFTTRVETTAERAFLRALSAGCSTPIGALATLGVATSRGAQLSLRTRCLSHDGARCIECAGDVELDDAAVARARELGERLAEDALGQGFRALI